MQPNDKPQLTSSDFEAPILHIMVDDKSFPVPGLETAFVDYSVFNSKKMDIPVGSSKSRTGISGVSTGTTSANASTTSILNSCMCNFVSSSYTICVCNLMKPVCNCHGHVRSSRIVGCRCAPVH